MLTVSKITFGLDVIVDKLTPSKSLETIASLGELMNLILPLLKLCITVLGNII